MTLKEIMQDCFTRGFVGLRNQGFAQSLELDECFDCGSNASACKYRSSGGLKCAVGHLIADDAYALKYNDGMGVDDMHSADADKFFNAIGVERPETTDDEEFILNFLSELQSCHDVEGDTPDEMESALREFAKDYQLEVPA